jgi:glucose uptake protein GlcU
MHKALMNFFGCFPLIEKLFCKFFVGHFSHTVIGVKFITFVVKIGVYIFTVGRTVVTRTRFNLITGSYDWHIQN